MDQASVIDDLVERRSGRARRNSTEERLELAAQAAQIGIWDWDLEQDSFVYSAIAKSICGLPPDREVTYADVVAVTHPEDLPRTTALMQRALDPAIRDAAPYEYRVVRPDREVRWVVAHGQAVFETAGAVTRAVRYVGCLQDITERRRLEEQNRSFNERLRFAMRAGRLGSAEYDLASGLVNVDATQLEILGLMPQDAPRTLAALWKYVHPQDKRRLRRLARDTFATGGSCNADFRIVRPSGEVRWCAGSASVICDPFGAPTHVFGYTVDMTERRRTEHELAERQAILQNILDAATLYIGVIEIAPDSLVFLMVNKASADLYRIRPDEVPADLRALGVTDREIANRRTFLLEVWEKGEPQTVEHPFTIRGERVAWCLGVYSPLPRLRDEPPRLSFVIIDITARKLADERQQLLMREVDHRAKNALAVAQAVVELTKESDPAAFKRAVVGRVSAIARTHSLLADGRWTGVDLQRLVSEELAPYATEAPARLQVDGPSHFLAPADAQLIGLIVHELVTNAAKYGALRGADGALAVRWTLDTQVLTFMWTETTPGATALSPPDRQGFGFRLLDQTIARQLGGAWKTDWTAQGLVFTMTLPLDRDRGDDELEPQMLRPAPVNEVRPPRRVLVAEDEPLIALELESRLEDLGFEVAARCGTLNEAMAAARGPVDLAILDVNLGGETTFELATILKRRGTRILFCTGYAALPLPGALAGSRVLFKPVNHDALAAAVESLAR